MIKTESVINENFLPNVKTFYPGMGQAVAERTVLRKKSNDEWETWLDVADRVSKGNTSLCDTSEDMDREFRLMKKHMAKASLLMSGRHLQHGDEFQTDKNMEVFCNCATSSVSFMLFYLLLNGAGVGRCYDEDMMLVNWDNAPQVRCVLDETHPDFDFSAHTSVRDAKHKYSDSKNTLWYKIPDSREGWAKALELWENSAFEKIHSDKLLVLDFSDVRPRNSLIVGMQNRPASGPVTLMNAFEKCGTVKNSGMKPWKQTMYIDHYMAECVLVGGSRRCLSGNTLVHTNKGWIEIQDINPSIHKVLFGGNEIDILELIDNGIQETVRIELEDESFFECTEEHKWFVYNHDIEESEWVLTKTLLTGNYSMLREL